MLNEVEEEGGKWGGGGGLAYNIGREQQGKKLVLRLFHSWRFQRDFVRRKNAPSTAARTSPGH